MFSSILNTPLPIVMITFHIKRFYTTSPQHTLVELNLAFGTILISFSVHFILIQVNLPLEEIIKILIT